MALTGISVIANRAASGGPCGAGPVRDLTRLSLLALQKTANAGGNGSADEQLVAVFRFGYGFLSSRDGFECGRRVRMERFRQAQGNTFEVGCLPESLLFLGHIHEAHLHEAGGCQGVVHIRGKHSEVRRLQLAVPVSGHSNHELLHQLCQTFRGVTRPAVHKRLRALRPTIIGIEVDRDECIGPVGLRYPGARCEPKVDIGIAGENCRVPTRFQQRNDAACYSQRNRFLEQPGWSTGVVGTGTAYGRAAAVARVALEPGRPIRRSCLH